jgi:hypothetical protein
MTKIMARILPKHAASVSLFIHSAVTRGFDEGQPRGQLRFRFSIGLVVLCSAGINN